MSNFQLSPGSWIAPILTWLNVNGHAFFSAIARFFDALVSSLVHVMMFCPPWLSILILTVVATWIAGWKRGLLTLGGLSACLFLGMWQATAQTFALVMLAVLFSIAVGVPIGIVLSRSQRAETMARPILDIFQTLPPWVYLVPFVILFGLGTVPALISTIAYGIAPMVRLTILAMAQIPAERIELGQSIGAQKRDILRRIELPSALPTLLVGVNQCILLSLSMVVLAGLVGAGGLGTEVTKGLTQMEFGLGLRASLAVVILAIMMDRVFRGVIPQVYLEKN